MAVKVSCKVALDRKQPPLLLAARALLELGADPLIADHEGVRPQDIAARYAALAYYDAIVYANWAVGDLHQVMNNSLIPASGDPQDLLAAAIETYFAGCTPNTKRAYRSRLERFLGWLAEQPPALFVAQLRTYIAYLQSEGLSDRSVQAHINTIKGCCAWRQPWTHQASWRRPRRHSTRQSLQPFAAKSRETG